MTETTAELLGYPPNTYLRCTGCGWAFSIETTDTDDRCTECDSPLMPATVDACEWCGGQADPSSVCPRSLTCPDCQAGPGGPCRRPSGHNCDMHAARVQLAGCCPRCGQTGTRGFVCDACRSTDRAPQGERVRMFTPPPPQPDGALPLF